MKKPKIVSCQVWNDWEGVLMPWTVHWVDFTFAKLSVEWDKRFGNAELHVAFLGCHFMLVAKIGEGDVEFQDDIKKTIEKWEKGNY